ncbi:MAG: hypothetical protein IPP90_15060 [Gemmatimonadaceae bacterium]|nr:hypothetical protein [Gemmatimonadaceae bacterium]
MAPAADSVTADFGAGFWLRLFTVAAGTLGVWNMLAHRPAFFAAHNAWEWAYTEPALLPWMFARVRR